MEHVILVDESDNDLGTMEKMEAHRKGVLHRAFSILIFNRQGEMLIQKRSGKKYHSAGLWTNTCCSHPRPGEAMADAISRKLKQEMGIASELEFLYKFKYRSELDNELTEHELDHVYAGVYDGDPQINPDEVESWRFVQLNDLQTEIESHPERFTSWFKLIMRELPNWNRSPGSVLPHVSG